MTDSEKEILYYIHHYHLNELSHYHSCDNLSSTLILKAMNDLFQLYCLRKKIYIYVQYIQYISIAFKKF